VSQQTGEQSPPPARAVEAEIAEAAEPAEAGGGAEPYLLISDSFTSDQQQAIQKLVHQGVSRSGDGV
jgi:hypothetical protein